MIIIVNYTKFALKIHKTKELIVILLCFFCTSNLQTKKYVQAEIIRHFHREMDLVF